MSEKRAREEQTDITLFLNKKPMTSLVAEPTTLFVEQTELIELPIPERQSIQELPNPMPKAESGHSIQKAWFEEFSWLKLAENHCSILAIHRELTHSMEIDPLIEEFIDSTAQRRNKFGPNPE